MLEIPLSWLHMGLDPFALRLLLYYAEKGDCFETEKDIARECVMAKGTMRDRRRLLAEKGLIEILPERHTRTLRVRLTISAVCRPAGPYTPHKNVQLSGPATIPPFKPHLTEEPQLVNAGSKMNEIDHAATPSGDCAALDCDLSVSADSNSSSLLNNNGHGMEPDGSLLTSESHGMTPESAVLTSDGQQVDESGRFPDDISTILGVTSNNNILYTKTIGSLSKSCVSATNTVAETQDLLKLVQAPAPERGVVAETDDARQTVAHCQGGLAGRNGHNAVAAQASVPSVGGELSAAAREYFRAFRRKRWSNLIQREAFEECEREVGGERMLSAVRWAATSNIANVTAICTAARRSRRGSGTSRDAPQQSKTTERVRLNAHGFMEVVTE